MSVIFLVVVVIKSIPKYKLPYCLGGTKDREHFICFDQYNAWCQKHHLKPKFDQLTLANFNASDAKNIANKTLLANSMPANSIEPDF
jgi:hypothetical protein